MSRSSRTLWTCWAQSLSWWRSPKAKKTKVKVSRAKKGNSRKDKLSMLISCYFPHNTCETLALDSFNSLLHTRRRQNGQWTDAYNMRDWKNTTAQPLEESCDRVAQQATAKGANLLHVCGVTWPLWEREGSEENRSMASAKSFDLYSESFFFFFKAQRKTTAAHRITQQHVYFA